MEREKVEISDDWKNAIKDAKERILLFHSTLYDEYFEPNDMERLLRAGLNKKHFEFVLVEPREAIHRMEMSIELLQHKIKEMKRKYGI